MHEIEERSQMDLISVGSAAKMLGVSSDRVRQLEREKAIKAIKTDTGVRLFQRKHIQEVARARARKIKGK